LITRSTASTDLIVACATEELIDLNAAVKKVVASVSSNGVTVGLPENLVVVGSSFKDVVSWCAIDVVAARAAAD
jgi:hypothetical protein